MLQRVKVIDSHTEGEPTRVVLDGFPELPGRSIPEKAQFFAAHCAEFQSSVVLEPRGHSAVVGALLLPSEIADAGIIFFNNVGVLGMCGHGTIGVVRTLQFLGRVGEGSVTLETPVGIVTASILADQRVRIQNVPSYRFAKAMTVEVPSYGPLTGDIAYGGNWFFASEAHGQELDVSRLDELLRFTSAVRGALDAQEITGDNGAQIDHIELFGPPESAANHSRNFVLCPGLEYDRSPCGTGTSAKIACLAADGKLRPGEVWRQESILGSLFEASYTLNEKGEVLPSITGSAYITSESDLIFESQDPFKAGIHG